MTITPTTPGWIGSLTAGDLVALKFYTSPAATQYVVDIAEFGGLTEDGELASFTSTFDDAPPYTWTAYICDGGWCYGNFDHPLAQLTHENAGVA
jgi:hypothetical protein